MYIFDSKRVSILIETVLPTLPMLYLPFNFDSKRVTILIEAVWPTLPYKLMHHLKPFAIVVLNGEITVYSVDSPNGRSANTKPCLDLSKW